MSDICLLEGAHIWPIRAPLSRPIKTSFGEMRSRPAVLLRLSDTQGNRGWGEMWVNFPAWACGAGVFVLHHMLRDIVPGPVDREVMARLYARYRTQAVQWGGLGPFYQALSSIDLAVSDLLARRAGQPLCQWLCEGAQAVDQIPVYASGIGPTQVAEHVERALSDGFRFVKIKVGFDAAQDAENFSAAQSLAGADHVMVDANQRWDVAEAHTRVREFADRGAIWVEEPVSALDFAAYRELAPSSSSLAAGENWYWDLLAVTSPLPEVGVFQPDLSKAGGFFGAERMLGLMGGSSRAGAFHVLGSPVVHAAALHGAAAWEDRIRWVEMDTNVNPFATAFDVPWSVGGGYAALDTARPGLGVAVDEEHLERFRAHELDPWCTITRV